MTPSIDRYRVGTVPKPKLPQECGPAMSPVKIQSAKFRWATPSRAESDEEGAGATSEAGLGLI